ncbi:MAG: endopeptidase La [Myxococcales bacterium]|nr:endopeptidase La [Myxococcales bacterium]
MNADEATPDEAWIVPVLPLQSTVIYPHGVATVQVGLEENIALLRANPEPDALLALAFIDGAAGQDLRPDALARIAVLSRVLDRLRLPGDGYQITFQGLRRVELVEVLPEGPYYQARLAEVDERTLDPFRVNVFVQKAINLYERLASTGGGYSKELIQVLKMNVDRPGRFADLLCSSVNFEYADKQRVLQAVGIDQRLQRVLDQLRSELDRVKVAQEVEKRAKGDIEESRREYFLRQQLKTIQRELGDDDLSRRDADDYTTRLEALGLPEEIIREAAREIERLRHIQPSSSEYQVIKTYLDRFFALPWGVFTEENIDLPRVRDTLDEGHFGLEKVKERILEFLAVRKLNPEHKGPILAFVGPPGVGKTSLGKAIAEAIGRKFFRISVGGVRDEAEIRGHRRTYVGALPGKILNGLTRAGTMNPLLMLDEIDKIGSDHRGDPAAALLEVLDPEQNNSFTDHYFNVPFDLSKVLFVVTGNYLHDIPKPLLDRLEVIGIEGYTENEKLEIARRHLVPKVLSEHGLTAQPPEVAERAVRDVIRFWTREAGVRNLQRSLEKICRKIAREQVEAESAPEEADPYTPPKLDAGDVDRYLGPRKFLHDEGIERDEVGVANGLAWTASGGEILVIEALKMPGKGKLVITGKLGEVMKESVQAAYSFVRSRAESLGLGLDSLAQLALRIPFPAGAVPKDGPSAGITMTTALASLLAGLPIRADFAMTGEVTLRGKVLPVGGIKDKLLAAYRAGIAHVALPKDNEKDLVEVPAEVRAATTFHPIDHVDRLLELALIGYAPPAASAPPPPIGADEAPEINAPV